MLTTCTFPLSVPTYNHLDWKGRWQRDILWIEKDMFHNVTIQKKGKTSSAIWYDSFFIKQLAHMYNVVNDK